MSIFSFIGRIGKDIAGVTQSANDLYGKLTEEEQKAATWASGALAIINQNITVDAPLLIPIIQSKFPDVTLDTITAVLTEVGALVTTTPPKTLADAITTIQAYLSPKSGNAWIVAVQGLVNLAATVISPETAIQKFVAVGEYVYQDIITPLLGLHKSSEPTVVATIQSPVATPVANPNPQNTPAQTAAPLNPGVSTFIPSDALAGKGTTVTNSPAPEG